MNNSKKYMVKQVLDAAQKLFQSTSNTLNYVSRKIDQKGIYLVKSSFGYTVEINGFALPFDLSWFDATSLKKYLEGLRMVDDGTQNKNSR